MADKKMSVQEFVKQYNAAKSETVKNGLIEKIIKRTYVPVLEKKMVLQFMLDKSIVTKENGMKHVDMFVHRINLWSSIIVLYSNLVFEKDEHGNPKSMEAYDLFTQNNLTEKLCFVIGERELNELTAINELLIESFYEENKSIGTFISNSLNALIKNFALFLNIKPEELEKMIQENIFK